MPVPNKQGNIPLQVYIAGSDAGALASALSESEGAPQGIAFTISTGQSLSSVIDLRAAALAGRVPVGVFLPAAWTTAGVSAQVSQDGSTYANLYEPSGEWVNTQAAAGVYLALDPTLFLGANYLKLRSGTGSTPVAQGADRSLVLMVREVS